MTLSVFTLLRFDLRAPGKTPAEVAALYEAALAMCAWADARGFGGVSLSEHHGTDDGYLPAPLPLATAFAARSENLRISIAALLLPMYDPVKLAEDLVVLDHVSRGRAATTLGLGYRAEEFAMFGVPHAERARVFEEKLEVLLRAFSGERFEWRGRSVRVTPAPFTAPHPPLLMGGQSFVAARRAARFGLPFQPASNEAALHACYTEECQRRGHAPVLHPPGNGEMVWVAEDPEREWSRIGRYLLHDARAYAQWQPAKQQTSAVHSRATTAEELRAEGLYRIVTPAQCVELARARGTLMLFPLCGGTPPELAWPALELFDAQVRPHLLAPAE